MNCRQKGCYADFARDLSGDHWEGGSDSGAGEEGWIAAGICVRVGDEHLERIEAIAWY